MSNPKYNDERYHIEESMNDGIRTWKIVNIYGETCFDDRGKMEYFQKAYAEHYCQQINLMPEGGIITNFI